MDHHDHVGNSDLYLRRVPYGYLQYSLYRSTELYHEQVGHFNDNIASIFLDTPSMSNINTQLSEDGTPCSHDNRDEDKEADKDDGYTNHQHHHDNTSNIDHDMHDHIDEGITVLDMRYSSPQAYINSSSFHVSTDTPTRPTQDNNNNNNRITSIEPRKTHDGIVYVGFDDNIYHLRVVIMGDQNAGKSTFLYSYTNEHDPAFILISRYIPVLQSVFYNARIIKHNNTNNNNSHSDDNTTSSSLPSNNDDNINLQHDTSLTSIRDQFPFIDSDLGLLQLTMTMEDFTFLIMDTVKCKDSKDNNSTDSSNDIKYTDMDIDTTVLSSYSHICIEFVEIGGDHLDRLVVHQIEHKYSIPIDKDNQVSLVSPTAALPNDSKPLFPSSVPSIISHLNYSPLSRADSLSHLHFGLSILHYTYLFVVNTIYRRENKDTTLLLSHTPHGTPDDQDSSISAMLSRTIHLLSHPARAGTPTLKQALLGVVGSKSSVDESGICLRRPSLTYLVNLDSLLVNISRPTLPIFSLDPCNLLILALRSIVTPLLSSQSTAYQSAWSIRFMLVRAPIPTYMINLPQHISSNTSSKPRYHSSFNTWLNTHISSSSSSPPPASDRSLPHLLPPHPDVISPPDYCISIDDLELPYEPRVVIDIVPTLIQLYTYLHTITYDINSFVQYSSILSNSSPPCSNSGTPIPPTTISNSHNTYISYSSLLYHFIGELCRQLSIKIPPISDSSLQTNMDCIDIHIKQLVAYLHSIHLSTSHTMSQDVANPVYLVDLDLFLPQFIMSIYTLSTSFFAYCSNKDSTSSIHPLIPDQLDASAHYATNTYLTSSSKDALSSSPWRAHGTRFADSDGNNETLCLEPGGLISTMLHALWE